MTQNLYAYCGNNPVNFVDPTGHFWESILKAIEDIIKALFGGGDEPVDNKVYTEAAEKIVGTGTTIVNIIGACADESSTLPYYGTFHTETFLIYKLANFHDLAMKRQDALVSNLWNFGVDEYWKKKDQTRRRSFTAYLMSAYVIDDNFISIAEDFHKIADTVGGNQYGGLTGLYYDDILKNETIVNGMDAKTFLNMTVLRGFYGGVNWKEAVMPDIKGVVHDAILAIYFPPPISLPVP